MATIVEFALKEEPLDVEKMRKCLLKQVSANSRSSLTPQVVTVTLSPSHSKKKAFEVLLFLIVAGES